MVEATQLKNGVTFEYRGAPMQVIRYEHQKIARGAGTVKIQARNLENGTLQNVTTKPGAKFEEIETRKKVLQFLYVGQAAATFMDPKTFEQLEIPLDVLGSQIQFAKGGQEVSVLFWGDRVLAIELPPKVILEVTEAPPGIKGNSADNVYKTVKLENGMSVKVPLFVKTGDRLRVDTRTGEYVERA